MLNKNTVLLGDCAKIMSTMPHDHFDLIFADPPYNLQLKQSLRRPDQSKVNAVDDHWDKFASFKDYDQFTENWLIAARRVLKPNGTIWVIGTYHNIFRIGNLLQNTGFWILNDIIWRKSNPMPNFQGTRFANAHETLIWAAKSDKSKYKFNYDALKSLNDQLQMRSDWVLPICTGQERLKNSENKKIHPTQKPESLLKRILIASTDLGDLILDPFFGTGTSGAVAHKLGRNFIGIDFDEKYCKAAQERIDNIEPFNQESLKIIVSKRKEPRVPFGNLIERGLLQPGEELFSYNEKYKAKVRLDGRIIGKDTIGSIHQVSAHLEGIPSCNGWNYWYFKEHGNQKKPISVLRDKVRSQMSTN